ncbi:MAG: CpaF family protein [Anaerolineae bacterium]|nr:CpaF family protein [Anaerolineae bacterium]
MTKDAFDSIDFGLLEPLLADSDVMEIMVNSTEGVFVERRGKIEDAGVRFKDEEEIVTIAQQIARAVGREWDDRLPMIDVRLPDGSRMNIVLRPVAINGPLLTLRKMSHMDLTWKQLVQFGSVSPEIVTFLQAVVRGRCNLVMAGGTGSGKTTIINALSEFIPHDERVVTVEQLASLQLRHPHVIGLETRPADADCRGEVTLHDLVVNAQKMRPDRIISSDVRGVEAWQLLHVMSEGYDGSMFTIHATSVSDVLERLEMLSTAATNLPLLQIRTRIAQGIDVIAQQLRLRDGSRKIVAISEVVGLKNNVIETQDIFRFEVTGEKDGRIQGQFRKTGYVPSFANLLDLPQEFYTL